MARRSELAAQVKDLQVKLAACQARATQLTADLAVANSTLQDRTAALAAAVMDKANLELELTTEREANATLSEQNEQLRTDLAAATTEITRLRAIIDTDPSLQARIRAQ